MTYILGLIVIGIFFFALHYFTELKHMQKIYIIIIILSILCVAIMYNEYTKQQSEKILQAVLQFKQGKTITCEGKKVNVSTYTLSIGTYTFIGREDSTNAQDMISASKCEVNLE